MVVPFGLHEVNTDNTFLMFVNSMETPDFIVDCLEKWGMIVTIPQKISYTYF